MFLRCLINCRFRLLSVCLFLPLFLAVSGCASQFETRLRKVPADPRGKQFHLTSAGYWEFSDRTTLTLRAYDLEKTAQKEPLNALVELQKLSERDQTQDLLYTFSELAYCEARKRERENPKLALEIYFAALLHSYQYLFDPQFERDRNPYDSQFRDVCLIYNHSLVRLLRLLGNEYELVLSPDHTYAIQSLDGTCDITCSMLTADWKGEEIEKFKFASDYEIKGLQNEYKQYGLGVPLIAVRKKGLNSSPAEKYYPPGLCFPVTAFLRPVSENASFSTNAEVVEELKKELAARNIPLLANDSPSEIPVYGEPAPKIARWEQGESLYENRLAEHFDDGSPRFHAVLELYDSTIVSHTRVGKTMVPLESDLTTPLAYFLSNPRLNNLSTIGLLRPDELLISRFIQKPGEELAKEEQTPKTAQKAKDGGKIKVLAGQKKSETENESEEKESFSEKIQDKLIEHDLIDEPDEVHPIKFANVKMSPGEKIDLTVVNHLVKRTDKSGKHNSNSQSGESLYGIYMMQPYDPNKIPVVMVHGLWSSPMTWMEMFNNLRSNPEIRDNYQFWFYFYPSAQPFWVSAAQLRDDLAEVRRTLSPHRRTPALEQMILVGHSMGGLVSRMQIVDGGDQFWKLVSDRPLEDLRETPEVKEKLQKWFYFQADPSISRVISIATPFHGSDYSNNVTQWLSNKLIRLPRTLTNVFDEFSGNNSFLTDNSLLKIETSVESLSPKNPMFPALLRSETPPDVLFNNIIGLQDRSGLAKYLEREGDGIVEFKSAKIDGVQSEINVPAAHSYVHTHPRSIMEVRRILLENVEEKKNAQRHGAGVFR